MLRVGFTKPNISSFAPQADLLHPHFKRFSRLAHLRLKDADSHVREDAAIALATCTLHLALHAQVCVCGWVSVSIYACVSGCPPVCQCAISVVMLSAKSKCAYCTNCARKESGCIREKFLWNIFIAFA